MNVFEHSKWLWCKGAPKENAYVDFFENFHLETVAVRYTLYISADSDYAVYVNGKLCAFGQYADYENYKVYDTIDLSDCFAVGENEIRVTVHYNGRSFSTYRVGKPGVIYALYANDQLFVISSRETMTALNPCYRQGAMELVSNQLGYTYAYDATREGVAAARACADVVSRSRILYPRPIKRPSVLENREVSVCAQGLYADCKQPELSLGKRLYHAYLSARTAKEMTGQNRVRLPADDGVLYNAEQLESTADGIYLVIDLAKESAGVLSLDIEVERDTDIMIGYGEHLSDLRPRSIVGDRNFAIYYRAKAGRNTFVGPFLRMGLRYMQLNVRCSRFRLYYAGIRPIEYPVDETPYFQCADRLHTKIYETCVHTLRTCMHTHYEDSPWREQALYAMDARNQMLCGYYALGEYDMARESIRLLALSLREDGYLALCAPAEVSVTIPSYSLIFVVMLEEYLRHAEDALFVRDMLPTAHVIVDHFRAQLATAKGVLKQPKEKQYWNFYEWQEGLDGTPLTEDDAPVYDAPLNAYFAMALRAMARLCEVCGEDEGAVRCLEDKELLDRRINDTFWDRERGAYCSYVTENGERFHYAELTNALMVYADCATYANESTVLSALAEKKLISVTLPNAIFRYEALLRRADRYARMVFDEIAEVWGGMLFEGATSFYELAADKDTFDGALSLCHGWSAVPAYLYFAYILGLKPTKDGFASYSQSPVSAGIYEAKGLAVTPNGKIKL